MKKELFDDENGLFAIKKDCLVIKTNCLVLKKSRYHLYELDEENNIKRCII